jgi:hypothetical protein
MEQTAIVTRVRERVGGIRVTVRLRGVYTLLGFVRQQ